MDLKSQIQQDLVNAMRAKDKDQLSTLRMLTAAIKQREVDERITLGDTDIIKVLTKMITQRQEAVAQFQTANRQDLIDKENAEIALLSRYMPQALSDAEVTTHVKDTITQLNATSIKDMGKVMGELQKSLAGRADMKLVSQLVKQHLAG